MSVAYIVVNDRLVGETTTDDPGFVDPESVEADLPWSIYVGGTFVWSEWFDALPEGTEVVRQFMSEDETILSTKRYTR